MKIDVLTLFPDSFKPMTESIIGRATKKNILDLKITNIRDFSKDKHHKCDDTPYGGGEGMVLTPQPLFDSIKSVKKNNSYIIYLSPKGRMLTQKVTEELSKHKHLVLICGHYEGIDQRVIDEFVDDEISIGDYVLTGGELPAMVLIDSVSRLLDGVLGNSNSYKNESFSNDLLECPYYTKPSEYEGLKVPEVLLNGNHKEIELWKQKEAIKLTKQRRPDLYYNKIKFVVRSVDGCIIAAKKFLSDKNRKTLYNNALKDFEIDEKQLLQNFDEYVEKQVTKIYKNNEAQMITRCKIYQDSLGRLLQEVLIELENIFGVEETDENIFAYLWSSVIAPYNSSGFYVPFNQNLVKLDDVLKTCIHELIHRFWWKKWEIIFKKKKKMLDESYPSTSWFLSEMVVHTITKNSNLMQFVGHRKLAYDDFYNMQFNGKALYEILDDLYKNNTLEDFMQLSYDFIEKNKSEMLSQYNR